MTETERALIQIGQAYIDRDDTTRLFLALLAQGYTEQAKIARERMRFLDLVIDSFVRVYREKQSCSQS